MWYLVRKFCHYDVLSLSANFISLFTSVKRNGPSIFVATADCFQRKIFFFILMEWMEFLFLIFPHSACVASYIWWARLAETNNRNRTYCRIERVCFKFRWVYLISTKVWGVPQANETHPSPHCKTVARVLGLTVHELPGFAWTAVASKRTCFIQVEFYLLSLSTQKIAVSSKIRDSGHSWTDFDDVHLCCLVLNPSPNGLAVAITSAGAINRLFVFR